MVSARLFAVPGAVLLGGAVLNEVTNFPVTLSQYILMVVVGLGGLCLAAFLVLSAAPGPLVEQAEHGDAQAPGRHDEAGIRPGLLRERQGQPGYQDDRPDDAEPVGRGEHATG